MMRITERTGDEEPEKPAIAEEPTELYITDLKCSRCDFGAFDVLARDGWRWRLACIYCGQITTGPPLMDELEQARAPDPGHSRLFGLEFREGRYAGFSLKQVASTDEGVEYLKWYANEGKSRFMKERVIEFLPLLDSNS